MHLPLDDPSLDAALPWMTPPPDDHYPKMTFEWCLNDFVGSHALAIIMFNNYAFVLGSTQWPLAFKAGSGMARVLVDMAVQQASHFVLVQQMALLSSTT